MCWAVRHNYHFSCKPSHNASFLILKVNAEDFSPMNKSVVTMSLKLANNNKLLKDGLFVKVGNFSLISLYSKINDAPKSAPRYHLWHALDKWL